MFGQVTLPQLEQTMSEHIQAQQAAADSLKELGIQATLMVHFPSQLDAPEGILLTTYDQLHSQIGKAETTAYAFPSFGAAQSVMRNIQSNLQTIIFIYECHANTSPVEVSAKVFDTCNKYMPTVREIRQITESMKYQKYPTVLYMIKMNSAHSTPPTIVWKVPEALSDEFIIPSRIAYELPDGKDLRQGQFPGITEALSSANGCYNSDKSKGSIPVTVKFHKASPLQILKVREAVDNLLQEACVIQDTQFQIKEGVAWHRLHKLGNAARKDAGSF